MELSRTACPRLAVCREGHLLAGVGLRLFGDTCRPRARVASYDSIQGCRKMTSDVCRNVRRTLRVLFEKSVGDFDEKFMGTLRVHYGERYGNVMGLSCERCDNVVETS